MIIGAGFIAKSFEEYYKTREDIVIFASGVSDSQCSDIMEFYREEKLLSYVINNLLKNELLVYFSTCSVYSKKPQFSSKYIEHKLKMEKIIENSRKYLIIRIPQIAGFSSNQNTLLNYFWNKINNEQELKIIKNSWRNILDIDDIIIIVNKIILELKDNSVINVANPYSTPVIDIIKYMEKIINKRANLNYIELDEDSYEIDIGIMKKYIDIKNFSFDEGYCFRAISRYYERHK